MTVKKALCLSLAFACAMSVSAQKRSRGGASGEDAGKNIANKVQIVELPKAGLQSLIPAPTFNAQMQGGHQPVNKKIRRWGVFELQYATYAKWVEEVTINWHILCDTSKAKQIDRSKNAAPLPKYVYYTAVTRYVNIPDGNHMACVCLPPSAIERYGEPVVLTAWITNKEGEDLALDGYAQGININPKTKWWEEDSVMSATDKKTGKQMIELRAGLLVDRSKTPFAVINSSDYEMVQ